MVEPEKIESDKANGRILKMTALDPEEAESAIRNVPDTVRAFVMEVKAGPGSWTSGDAVARLSESVRGLEAPLILLATGGGRFSADLSEAFDLCFFDEKVILVTPKGDLTASEAESRGLVNLAASSEEARRAAYEAANSIASLAPLAVRVAKRAVRNGSAGALRQRMDLENRLFRELFATRDMREGTMAFLEKRVPDFRGE
ncbi:MAG TPA: enoyl-CoA hydratase-related protein [Aridibacter sp.]|nr:enoyl-CoA hydratase-related protein [Aridibacter sp.]